MLQKITSMKSLQPPIYLVPEMPFSLIWVCRDFADSFRDSSVYPAQSNICGPCGSCMARTTRGSMGFVWAVGDRNSLTAVRTTAFWNIDVSSSVMRLPERFQIMRFASSTEIVHVGESASFFLVDLSRKIDARFWIEANAEASSHCRFGKGFPWGKFMTSVISDLSRGTTVPSSSASWDFWWSKIVSNHAECLIDGL